MRAASVPLVLSPRIISIASPPQRTALPSPDVPASGPAQKSTLAPAAVSQSHATPTPIPIPASCLDATCLDAYAILSTGLAAFLPSHECRITNAECRDPPSAHYTTHADSMCKTPPTRRVARAQLSKSARADHACALNPCPRPRFCLHHTRHSAKMRIWWPVTSHQVPLFALSGGSQRAKSKAAMQQTRPMIG